jgi:putative SOS response-associated peptidase YedK
MEYMHLDDACGDFSLEAYADALKTRYGLFRAPNRDYRSYDTRPGQISAVVYAGEDGSAQLEDMQWGFQIERKNPPSKLLLFNTRDDNAFRGFWKPLITRRRALIPATGYFEWTKPPKGTPKQKYFFHPKQIDLFSFAGVWNSWKDSGGKVIKAFSIVTTEPNKEAAEIHNRMPVILRKEDEASYLDPSKTEPKDIELLLHPYEDSGLEVFEVSNNTRAFSSNDHGLIAPLNSA